MLEASCGQTAYELYKAGGGPATFCLVLMDCRMPGMDGWQVRAFFSATGGARAVGQIWSGGSAGSRAHVLRAALLKGMLLR